MDDLTAAQASRFAELASTSARNVTKGHGPKPAGLAMVFKLIESAQRRWRMVNAPQLVALVRAGATFINGKLVERPDGRTLSPNEPSQAVDEEAVAEAA
jgi:hypothetical protein